MKAFKNTLLTALLCTTLTLTAAFALSAWWIHQPLGVAQTVEFTIAAGTGARSAAQVVAQASSGQSSAALLEVWFRLSGQASKIKAGTYALTPSDTPQSLLKKLVLGDAVTLTLTIPEGWTLRQMRQTIEHAPFLKITTAHLSDQQLLASLGLSGFAEGRFFPDTYRYPKGSSDLAIYKAANAQLEKVRHALWADRAQPSALKSPDELLILASLVEKETGRPADRSPIAGVFSNRLRLGMLLQTDPSVIYGLGERFEAQRRNLTKADLQRDTPFNTYTRVGLPPTPIALVGRAALTAAAKPDRTEALYFVARGDGSSQFSASLAAHNRAVNQYILQK